MRPELFRKKVYEQTGLDILGKGQQPATSRFVTGQIATAVALRS